MSRPASPFPPAFPDAFPRRLRVLCAVPSTNQMYSGVGRALRELARRMAPWVDYAFATDDLNPRNVALLRDFCQAHGFPFHLGRHRIDPRGVDPANDLLPSLLRSQPWEAVELIGFANASTGQTVLDHLGEAALLYTPHDQPLWTVPMSPEQARFVADTHLQILRRADLVLADSPHERAELQALVPSRSHVRHIPLGCDFDAFQPGPTDRPPRLLFVGDLNEIRKRFDRVAALLPAILDRWPEYRLVVVGNRSDELAAVLPETARAAVELRGYVAESELHALYRTSRAMFLLSEVEAFGLPILEALACGTPVFLSDLPTTRSLFADFPAARFCPHNDPDATLRVVVDTLAHWPDWIARGLADRPALRERFDWNQLARAKAREVAAAWFRRRPWALVA